jgi:cytochrome c oxidase assembly factor CtaG/ferredoxin
MEGITDAVFSSWNLDPWLLIPALVIGLLYARGWKRQYKRAPDRFGWPQLVSFYAGLITVLFALVSPLDTFAGWLLTVHMIQHLLLMMVAPPLILYGNPYLPLLAGMPRRFLKDGMAPFLASVTLRKVGRFVTHPVFCWTAFVFTSIAWHTPPMYQLALSSPSWHAVEHFCFLATALLFWSPIIQPYPLVPQLPRWAVIPYLFLADFQNTALSAFLMFYERVLYPAYETVPRITGMSALEDQVAAGAIMWVAGSIFFLIPVGLITIEVLSRKRTPLLRKRVVAGQSQLRERTERQAEKQSRRPRAPIDLLSLPLIGSVLRWPHFRRSVQAVMFLLAIIVVADGFFGPQMGAMNLAGVLPWTHWRGLSAIALLALGNVFCMACPFNFVRDLGRRLLPAAWVWPRRLRSKWIAISLLFVFFWAYEAFGLWDSPRWTAWIIVGYFTAALVVDGLFKGASFCKYVCPIGQYQFIQSLISPVEVGVRSLDVCRTCTTHDCLRGNDKQRGCELQLFQPQKTSNMDCTFCLDCVHACPHQNVSLLATLPGTQLVRIEGRKRSLRWFRRFDGAVLIFLLVFAAFVNAGSMLESVQRQEQTLQLTLHSGSFHLILLVSFLFALVVVPAMLIAASVSLAKILSGRQVRWRESVSTFAQAFVPLGFSMWLAHFSYHLVNGALTAVPVIQRAAESAGLSILGKPDWSLSASMSSFDWLPSVQLFLLGLGLLFTLYVAWRAARGVQLQFARTLGLVAPWAVLALVLYSAGVWIVFQPMQMRGMMMDGTTEWCISE